MKHLVDQYGFQLSQRGRGDVTIFAFDPLTKRVIQEISTHNLILFSGADVLAQCLAGNSKFAVTTMYLEFKNLGSPGDPIVPPAFDRTGGIGYYNGLVSSLDTDFIRVPLTVNPTITPSGLEYNGNRLTFFGMTEGTTGFFGKPFNPGVNSAVYGAGLIAAPDADDQSQDVVFSRVYAGIDKVLKQTGYEIGVVWTVQLN